VGDKFNKINNKRDVSLDQLLPDIKNKRNNLRYDVQRRVKYNFFYDFNAKVKGLPVVESRPKQRTSKFLAQSKNISLDGVCFNSKQSFQSGDKLQLEIYIPGGGAPVQMSGEVKWSKATVSDQVKPKVFDTGIKLLTIDGELVEKTIYFDKKYGVYWSNTLEAVLGKYRLIQQKKR